MPDLHQPNRRDFLRVTTAAVVAAGASGALAGTAVADVATPQGQHLPKSAIGIQLYTVRSLMSESVEKTLAFLAGVGYAEVEPAGLFGKTPAQFRRILDENHLRAPSAHVSIPYDKAARQQLFEGARTIGQKWVTQAYFGGDSIDAYKAFADHLNQAGEEARQQGLRIAYHNHSGEFAPKNGKVPYYVLLQETDPHLVDFELDIYWAVTGGADPVALFDRFPKRFKLSHVKDRAPDGSFADVGKGTIDFGRIFAAKSVAGLHHYFVERDSQPHPKETARDSYQYLRQLTFRPGNSGQ